MSSLADVPEVLLPSLPATPYPGLRPFEKAEWPIFVGREKMTNEVSQRLLEQRMVFVHGPSGGGKSSLVRAGVQASLEQKHARSELRWRSCVMRPGVTPLSNLAEALASLVESNGKDTKIEVHRALNHGRNGLPQLIGALKLAQTDRVCILLDQFEEIFRYRTEFEREEAGLLTDFLIGFLQTAPSQLYVLATMRSDYLGECSRVSGLANIINATQYLLPKMETSDLLRAIEDPAELFGWRVTTQLSERIIADASSGHDELPLIQHGLARLWEYANDNQQALSSRILELPIYETWGPLDRLVSDHADEVTTAIKNLGISEAVVEGFFRALTDVNVDGNAVRRPQQLRDIASITCCEAATLKKVAEAFRRPGVSFLTPYSPSVISEDTTIDVSHEALIRRWKVVADPATGWLQREFRDGLIWRSLVVMYEGFALDAKNLLSEATTEARSEWIKGRNERWAERYGGNWHGVQKLLSASRSEISRRTAEADQRRKDIEDLKVERERRAAAEKLASEQTKRIEAESGTSTEAEALRHCVKRFFGFPCCARHRFLFFACGG